MMMRERDSIFKSSRKHENEERKHRKSEHELLSWKFMVEQDREGEQEGKQGRGRKWWTDP